MSDRTKFFAEKNARAKNAADQRQREGKEVRKRMRSLNRVPSASPKAVGQLRARLNALGRSP